MFRTTRWLGLQLQPLVNSYKRPVTNYTYASSSGFAEKFKQPSCTRFSRDIATTTCTWSNVISSPYRDVHIPQNKHLAEHILQNCSTYGERPALVDAYTGQTYTYNEFKDKTVGVSSALRKRGFKEGDVLAIYCPNCPDWGTAFVGTALAGGAVSAANPQYTTEELAGQLVGSNSKLLFTHKDLLGNALKAAKMAPNVQEVFVIGGGSTGKSTPFSALLEDDRSSFCDNLNISPTEDIAALPYSSGTTGLPKCVMLTHYNIISNVEQLLHEEAPLYGENDTLLAVLPFYHIYGQAVVLLGGLSRGAKIVTVPKFEPEQYLQTVQDHRATSLQIVPPLAIFLAKHPMVDRFDLSSVDTVTSGAAPLDENLGKLLHDRIKFKHFRQGFGMTETIVTNINYPGSTKYASCGPPLPNTILKMVDIETGESLPPRQQGEMWIKGPQVMKGYLNNPEATAQTITDGWLRSGDLGYYDEDGHIYITDRLKELIKYKGFQVPPAELEGILLTHPSIQDSAVVGMKDDVAGELPRAYVVRKPGVSLSEKEVQSFVEGKVAPHKKLTGGVVFIDEIPKTASGKILRKNLRDQA